jgi:hypothetical protein
VSAGVEERLAWEAEQRPRMVGIAIAAGLLTIFGNVLFAILIGGGPSSDDGIITVTESLGARIAGGAPEETSLVARQLDYYGDNVLPLTLSTILTTAAAVLAGLVLLFLYRATQARAENVSRIPWYAAISGVVLFGVGHLARQLGVWLGAAGFEGGADATAQEARDVVQSPLVVTGQLFELIGSFALALAFVLVGMNAMRVGVLTRFLGVLAIIVGGLAVFQLDQPQIVRAFWLVAVGLMLAGRSPGGLPPAWQTGRAEPWPSNQQLREAREAAKRAAEGGGDGGAEAPAPSRPAGAQPAQKRKRKRRR